MNTSGSLFSQILSLFNRTDFHGYVRAIKCEYRAKGFTCWEQFVAMMFCQLAQARSLREITDGLQCCLGKLKHLGLEAGPKRSTLSYANAHRPWQLYARLFYDLLERCRQISPRKKFRFKNKLLTLDSTTIELCASLFDWAKWRQTKGAIKLHLLLDNDGYLPVFAHLSEGKTADLMVAQGLDLPRGSIVVLDRGYIDYRLFAHWTEQGVYFVTRLKDKAAFSALQSRELPANSEVHKDELGRLNIFTAGAPCRHDLRRIEVWLPEKQESLVLLTNNLHLAASTIVAIYKERWQIELFFKALKQQLKIKTFVGTSSNAVHIQIWTALIAMLLLKYLQFRSRFRWALSNLVALLRWNLFSYRDLWQWLDDPLGSPPLDPMLLQLNLMLDSTVPNTA